MKARFVKNIFGHWIVLHPTNDNLAWSGMQWVPIDENKLGMDVQVSNFDTLTEAQEYAIKFGFTV